MKKLSILLTLILSLSFIGCTKDVVGTIEMFQHTVVIGSGGGQKYFTIKSSHNWSATCDADWITITTETGPSGNGMVKFTAEPSWEITPREAAIILTNTASTENYSMTVKQDAFEPVFEVSPESVDFSNKGGVSEFSVTANFEYEVTCEADWISFEGIQEKGVRSEESGEGDVVYESARIIFSVATSQITEERSADIIITCTANNEIKKAVTVTQAAFAPSIKCTSGETICLSASAQKKYITFSSNVTFVPSFDVEWMSVYNNNYSKSHIYLDIQANTSAEARTGNIILYNEEYDYTVTFPVTQLAGAHNAIEMENGDFENGLNGWSIKNYNNGSKVTVEVIDGAGVDGSKAVKISQPAANGKCCVAVERKLTGLDKEKMYRMVAKIKYESIASGCGAVMFSPNTNQYWNSSAYTSGNSTTYKEVYVDFLSDASGNATISCALGFWQGGLANGGYATGTVYYDDVYVVKATESELYMREANHIQIFFNPLQTTASDATIQTWLNNIDDMYDAFEELVGDVPQNGRKIALLSTPGMYSGYWALAGYPILLNERSGLSGVMSEIINYGTLSFGLMHEIGHVFNLGQTTWNWNDEMFANFRMQYALEKTGNGVHQKGNGDTAKKVYTGREILNMYKQDYDMTLPTGKLNDNAIHYLLARLAGEEFIGWEPFKLTFQYMRKYGISGGSNINTKYDKFVYFVNRLSKYASEVHGKEFDLLNDKNCFSDADIAAIKKQLQ